jgi:hypothetical protein
VTEFTLERQLPRTRFAAPHAKLGRATADFRKIDIRIK